MFYASKENKKVSYEGFVVVCMWLFTVFFSDMSLPGDKHRRFPSLIWTLSEVTCEHFNRQDSKAALQIPGSWQTRMYTLVSELLA